MRDFMPRYDEETIPNQNEKTSINGKSPIIQKIEQNIF